MTSSRQRILDAYEDVLAADGERHATVEAVAAKAGVSKGGVLYHFPSKDRLAEALYDRVLALAAEDVDQMRTAPDEDGRAALRARAIGFVFQSFQLLPHLTALENVLLPLELTGRTPEGEEPVAAARTLLGRVGLAERLSHYPKYLSGGEQQRVALARAFVLRPPLLLADEPTGSLDARTGEAVIDLMFELNRERGSTLVLVTHDADIAKRCGRRIELAAGRVVSH